MGEKKEDSKEKTSKGFDYKKELSSLVEKKVIPSRVADKLNQKIKEKNVDLTKKQLHMIVNKIRNILDDYLNLNQEVKPQRSKETTGGNKELKQLVETVEKLNNRMENLEKGALSDDHVSPSIVTTEDISVEGQNNAPRTDHVVKALTEVPNDPESIIILMKWLQYLIDKCGRSNLSDILDYYVDIGWISEGAKISLLDYSNGITDEGGDKDKKKITDLPSKDHVQSLLFIQKLKGRHFDKHFLDRIDGEINRLTKKVESNIGK